MPLELGQGNCQYTGINTAGTSTLNPGPAGAPTTFGVFYGVATLAAGTGFGYTVYDIVPAVAQVAASTNTLMNGTNTAGVVQAPGQPGVGVRYKGALVVVTSGTPGLINALWD